MVDDIILRLREAATEQIEHHGGDVRYVRWLSLDTVERIIREAWLQAQEYPDGDRGCAYGCGPCRWEPGPWHQRGCPSWRAALPAVTDEREREIRAATKGHTPGPWSVPHFADSEAKCECGYVFAREDAKTVCEVNYHDFRDKYDQHLPRSEAAANAHLIASASDLLSLLDAARAERDQWRDEAGNSEEQRAEQYVECENAKAELARLRAELAALKEAR